METKFRAQDCAQNLLGFHVNPFRVTFKAGWLLWRSSTGR